MTPPPSPRAGQTVRGLFLLALCASLCWATPAHAQRRGRGDTGVVLKTDAKFLAAFRDVVAGAAQGTVRVLCDGEDAALGAVVGADGWIVTKASELKGDVVCRLHDGREFSARIVGVQEPYDLAMLKVEAKGLTPVTWRGSEGFEAGNWLATPGMGEDPVAVGVLSVGKRKVGKMELNRLSSSAGFLGIEIDRYKKAVVISKVFRKTGADKAGLKKDDRIVTIDDKAITDHLSLHKALQKKRPGEVVVVRVRRGDEELELEATLGERPEDLLDRSDFQNRLGSKLSRRRTGFPVILQHDSILRPSDCGGPVVDLDGKVVGINIARAGRTETYAIPAEVVKGLLADLKSGKLAPKK